LSVVSSEIYVIYKTNRDENQVFLPPGVKISKFRRAVDAFLVHESFVTTSFFFVTSMPLLTENLYT
jgi:hypothetical protein